MTQIIDTPRKKSILLELISDTQLNDLRNSNDLLFTGKMATKDDGGFKKLYDLPPTALLDQLKYGTLTDALSIRVKHQGWLCNRDSGWATNMCILFASHGLLFVYIKPTKGYVVKMSYAMKLEIFCGRKKIEASDTPPKNCRIKLKLDFGSLEIQLTKNQVEKWRLPLLNAFDGKLPCFETTKIRHNEEVATEHADENKIDANESICVVTNSTTDYPTATSVKASSTASSFGSLFSVPLSVESNVESENRDSGIGFDEEMEVKFENIPACYPILPMRKITASLSASTSPKFRNTAFNLPVYRLETEREKLSRREPQTRIAEKIRYFEDILGENGNKASDADEKLCSTI